jgi:hypothetical protein
VTNGASSRLSGGRFAFGWVKSCLITASVALSSGPGHSTDDDVRWRVFDREGEVLLLIAGTDEPSDDFGLPALACKKGLGAVSIEGEAKESLRVAMADAIRTDKTPWIQVAPDAKPETTSIDLFYSFVDGWRYRFNLNEDHKAFERFGREGVIEFKLGHAVVREEFKPGIESASRFLELCKRHPGGTRQ